jgi:hypothetical protein
MESFAFSPRTLFKSGRSSTLYEALWAYVISVGCITLLSVVTGVLLALMMEASSAILGMRLINGVATFLLTLHVMKHQNKRNRVTIIAAIAGGLSASGYEIIGLIVPAALTIPKVRDIV